MAPAFTWAWSAGSHALTWHGQLNFPLDPSQYAAAAKQFIHLIPVEKFPYLNGMSQEVIARRHDGMHQLELGLDLILDGLARMRAAS